MRIRTCCVRHVLGALAVGLLVIASRASAQSVAFDFEDSTDQGFGLKFSNDASKSFPIITIGGSKRLEVLRTGGFQEADVSTGTASSPLYQALAAAVANPAGYKLSYDYYIDTSLSPGQYGGFLQVGTYINLGDGTYRQDFGTPKEVELNGAQLGASAVYQGNVSFTLASKTGVYDSFPAGNNFFRLGLILNGDGANAKVYFDNITVTPVPEPTSLALLGLGGLWLASVAIRRRSR